MVSFSEIRNLDQIIFLKKTKTSLKNFLFGSSLHNKNPNWITDLQDPNKRYYQMTIYLSLKDSHRFYSPSNIYISERIYIPGFLEPLNYKYFLKHKKDFALNERVTLKCTFDKICKNKDDKLFITLLGSLNIGSINLNFDDYLKTNDYLPILKKNNKNFYHLRYSEEMYISIPLLKRIKDEKLYDEKKEYKNTLLQEFCEHNLNKKIDLNIFNKKKKDTYSNKEKFRFYIEKIFDEFNCNRRYFFKEILEKDYLNKNIIEEKIEKHLHNKIKKKFKDLKINNFGIKCKIREEIGYFNYGSSIVLVFSYDKEKEVISNFLEGEQIKIGQSLISIK